MTIHPNLIDHWFEWEDTGGKGLPKLIAVLKTDAVILPQSDGFDSGTLDDMIDAVRAEYPDQSIAFFRIVPVRATNA